MHICVEVCVQAMYSYRVVCVWLFPGILRFSYLADLSLIVLHLGVECSHPVSESVGCVVKLRASFGWCFKLETNWKILLSHPSFSETPPHTSYPVKRGPKDQSQPTC